MCAAMVCVVCCTCERFYLHSSIVLVGIDGILMLVLANDSSSSSSSSSSSICSSNICSSNSINNIMNSGSRSGSSIGSSIDNGGSGSSRGGRFRRSTPDVLQSFQSTDEAHSISKD